MARAYSAVFIWVMAYCAPSVWASAFLHVNNETEAAAPMPPGNIMELLMSIQPILDTTKVAQLEEDMKTLYKTLPKTPEGALEAKAASLGLVRYFESKYGWHTGHMLSALAFDGSRFHLHEVSAVATGFLEMVRRGVKSTVLEICSDIGVDDFEKMQQGYFTDFRFFEFYFLRFVFGDNIASYADLSSMAETDYIQWPAARAWVHDVVHTAKWSRLSRANPFVDRGTTLEEAFETAQAIVGRYTEYQRQECIPLMQQLHLLEFQGTGRIPLAKFYAHARDSVWNFNESPEYLRHLGALDETDPQHPTVIIPNYYGSGANCVGASPWYQACCPDMCDPLMAELERKLAAPTATPEQVVEVVSQLSSDTVDAPRNLSSGLLQRLDLIAAHHGGRVPLHGRLFAQWMHHNYPRECPFPQHGIKETAEMYEESGAQALVEEERMDSVINSSFDRSDDALPWTAEEDLVAVHHEPAASPGSTVAVLRNIAALTIIASMAVPLVRTTKHFLGTTQVGGVNFRGDKLMV